MQAPKSRRPTALLPLVAANNRPPRPPAVATRPTFKPHRRMTQTWDIFNPDRLLRFIHVCHTKYHESFPAIFMRASDSISDTGHGGPPPILNPPCGCGCVWGGSMEQLSITNASDKTLSSRPMGGMWRGPWWRGGREGCAVAGAGPRLGPAHRARLLGLGCVAIDFSADTSFLRAQMAQ